MISQSEIRLQDMQLRKAERRITELEDKLYNAERDDMDMKAEDFRKGQKVWRVKHDEVQEGKVIFIEPCSISGSGSTAHPDPKGKYTLVTAEFGGDRPSATCDNHLFCSTKKAAYEKLAWDAARYAEIAAKDVLKWTALANAARTKFECGIR